jgi:hypothetical protein
MTVRCFGKLSGCYSWLVRFYDVQVIAGARREDSSEAVSPRERARSVCRRCVLVVDKLMRMFLPSARQDPPPGFAFRPRARGFGRIAKMIDSINQSMMMMGQIKVCTIGSPTILFGNYAPRRRTLSRNKTGPVVPLTWRSWRLARGHCQMDTPTNRRGGPNLQLQPSCISTRNVVLSSHVSTKVRVALSPND